MPYRYVPVLRTKAAEIPALANLSSPAKARTFPILRMTETIPTTLQSSMIARLQEFPFSLDGGYNFEATGSPQIFISLFDALGNAGLSIVPAVSTNDDPDYISAALGLVGRFGNGIVVISTLSDIGVVAAWCNARSLNRSDVDLVITVGDVSNLPVSFGGYVHHAISAVLNNTPGWRSVALHSFSAARDHSGYNRGRTLVPRKCWQLWNNVIQNALPFQLDYSDCGHIHASLEEVPGVAMINATVSVRYTINDNWVVIKGSPTRGPSGSPMAAQYRAHAIALTQEAEFNQIPGCWGDDRIRHYATTAGGTGGRPQWVQLLLNRHISHVCERLP